MAPGTPMPKVTGKEMNWSEEEVGFSAGSRSDCRAGPGHGVSPSGHGWDSEGYLTFMSSINTLDIVANIILCLNQCDCNLN